MALFGELLGEEGEEGLEGDAGYLWCAKVEVKGVKGEVKRRE